MKKIIKLLVSSLLAAVMALSFSACGGNDKLIMATNAAFPPFEFKDGNQTIGIDIEIAKAIAKEMGKELEIRDVAFEAVFTSVAGGQADMALAGITVSEERKKTLDFSISYFEAAQYVIVKANDERFAGYAELAAEEQIAFVEGVINSVSGIKIGYQYGTTAEFYAKGDEDWGFDGFENANTTGFDNGAQAVSSLINGAIDIVIIDELPAKALVGANSGNVKLVDVALTAEEYAIAVKKGNTELLESINKVLQELMGNGELQKVIDKFIEEYIK